MRKAPSSTTTRPSTSTCVTSLGVHAYTSRATAPPPGSACSASSRTTARSARLPVSREPVNESMPSTRAPSMVAIARASSAFNAAASPRFTFARSAACRSSVKGSIRLLQGAPSAPIPTSRPASRIATTSAMPLASLRFALGQCAKRVPARASVRISPARSCTPCARTVRGPVMPKAARAFTSSRPSAARTARRSSACSAACEWSSTPGVAWAASAAPRSSASLHERMKRGA